VIVMDRPTVPRIAPGELLLSGARSTDDSAGIVIVWEPDRAPTGPVSIVVSAADRRVVVLRNGVVIGSAPVAIDGKIERTPAFVLQEQAGSRRRWLRIRLLGQGPAETATDALHGRIRVSDSFAAKVEAILHPGTTVVVTADSVRTGASAPTFTVLESDKN